MYAEQNNLILAIKLLFSGVITSGNKTAYKAMIPLATSISGVHQTMQLRR